MSSNMFRTDWNLDAKILGEISFVFLQIEWKFLLVITINLLKNLLIYTPNSIQHIAITKIFPLLFFLCTESTNSILFVYIHILSSLFFSERLRTRINPEVFLFSWKDMGGKIKRSELNSLGEKNEIVVVVSVMRTLLMILLWDLHRECH